MNHSTLVRVCKLAVAGCGILTLCGCSAREPSKDAARVDEVLADKPAPTPVDSRSEIVGPEWICIEIDGVRIADAVGRPTLRFDGDGRISGRSPINRYGADFVLHANGALELGPVMSTLMAGSEQDMSVESAFMRALREVSGVALEAELLAFAKRSDGGAVTRVLLFERMPLRCGDGAGAPLPPAAAAPLAEFAGGEWVLVAMDGQPLPADAAIAIKVGADGSLQGHGGVNRFGARCVREGAGLRIGPIVATEMAGPLEAGARERRFFAALEAARSALGEGSGELSLRDGNMREVLLFRRR